MSWKNLGVREEDFEKFAAVCEIQGWNNATGFSRILEGYLEWNTRLKKQLAGEREKK